MKEYYLVPAHEIDDAHAKKHTEEGDKSKDKQLFDNKQITKSDIIELHNQLNRLRRQNETNTSDIYKSEDFSKLNYGSTVGTKQEDNSIVKSEDHDNISTRESKPNKSHEEIISANLGVIPKDYVEKVRNFIHLVLQHENVDLDQLGNILLVNTGKKILLKDFFRGLFVRNAKIKHIRDFLKEILKDIEDILIKQGSKFVRNEKVFELISEINHKDDSNGEEQSHSDLEEEAYLSFTGGKLSKVGFIPWIVYRA